MASPNKTKEIQVQKPAQSLQAFQAKLGTGEPELTYLKPVLIGVGAVLVGAFAFFGIRAYRANAVEKHETALAGLVLAVDGNPLTPSTPADIEKRMRENLPKLETLAKQAPSSQKAVAEGILAAWRLELDGKGGVAPRTDDPWSRLRSAQRFIALGQGKEALGVLDPMKAAAKPTEAWGHLYWETLLQARTLQGERDQALKDYAEYKQRFREQADISAMERILIGI